MTNTEVRRRAVIHIKANKAKYGIGSLAVLLVFVQVTWDIAANLIASYIAPWFGLAP